MIRSLALFFYLAATLLGQQSVIFTVAGGEPPITPSPAAKTSIGDPPRVAFDPAGNLYFGSAHAIFKVDKTGTLTRIAGTGKNGVSGDGGSALAAQLSSPLGIAFDAAGNLYFTDKAIPSIRRIGTNGIITTFAGISTPGYGGDGGPASAALFNAPFGLTFDSSGNLYVADSGNNRIRKISPGGGTISTVAGSGPAGDTGDGAQAVNATLNRPEGVAVDASGNLYIADTLSHRIRKVSPDGAISTVAGTGLPGTSVDQIPATTAALFLPTDVAVDRTGVLYLADLGSSRIRKVVNGNIVSIAGVADGGPPEEGSVALSVRFNGPTGMALDPAGNVYFAEGSIGSGTGLVSGDYRVWEVDTTGTVHVVAGNGLSSYSGDGGLASRAQLNTPAGLAFDTNGNLFVADSQNHRVRKISPNGNIVTIAGTGEAGFSGDYGPALEAQLNSPSGVVVDEDGRVFIADTVNNRIRAVLPDGSIRTIAGNGNGAYTGDNGPADQAAIRAPLGLTLDGDRNIYIADTLTQRIRKVTLQGVITTVAGTGNAGLGPDGGQATNTSLSSPSSIVVDPQGNIYFTDQANQRVRKITPNGTLSTVAGGGSANPGDGGKATAAQLSKPQGLALDQAGNLYIADGSQGRVRKVSPDGTITTVAGNGACCYTGDGGPATDARMDRPWGLAIDSSGSLFISDSGNNAIRRVSQASSASFILSVVNGASGLPGGVARGEVVTIYGAGLGPQQLAQYPRDGSGFVDTLLAGTRVLFNGTPGAVLYTSAGQVSAVVPYNISGSQVSIAVEYNGAQTPPALVSLVDSAPAIFTADASGSGQALAFNQDGLANNAGRPASQNSQITFYATGEGQTNPPGIDGKIASGTAPQPVLTVSVTVGGQRADVLSAAGAPGSVAGVMVVRVQLPSGIAGGNAVPIVLQVGGPASTAATTIAIAGN